MTRTSPYDDITTEEIPDVMWGLLQMAIIERRHPFHTPALFNGGAQGAEARTVVLRLVDPDSRALHCHTDIRSPKVEALRSDPKVGWLFYDAQAAVQLRLKALATLHHQDEIAEAGWANSTRNSRQCYRHEIGPGVHREQGGEPPTFLDADGYDNFTVLRTVVHEMEWLFLRHSGHQRCRFSFVDNQWRPQWLAP